eukprot:m.187417 g.187417  ORF g.187417 m.187417 type:complete len:78 (+) comp18505_c1_seq12:2347-2580(+)
MLTIQSVTECNIRSRVGRSCVLWSKATISDLHSQGDVQAVCTWGDVRTRCGPSAGQEDLVDVVVVDCEQSHRRVGQH